MRHDAIPSMQTRTHPSRQLATQLSVGTNPFLPTKGSFESGREFEAPSDVDEPDRLSAGDGSVGSFRLSPLNETELARRFPSALADGPALSVLGLGGPSIASDASLIGRKRSRRSDLSRRASVTPTARVKLASNSRRGNETAKA